MKETVITCKTKKEYNSVLQKLEKMGAIWQDSRKLPTNRDVFMHSEYFYIRVKPEGNKLLLTYGTDARNLKSDANIITAKKFLKELEETIVIYRDGNTVVAVNKNTHEKAIARCHPDDEFDFGIGAKIALERLTEKDTEPTPKEEPPTFKVGDMVKVRDNLILDKKYGNVTLKEYMLTKCPLTVVNIESNGSLHCGNQFWYSPQMLVPYSPTFKCGETVALKCDLVVGKRYGECELTKEMACFGKPMTVSKILQDKVYKMTNGHVYSEEMLTKPSDTLIIGAEAEIVSGECYPQYTEWVDNNVENHNLKYRYNYGGCISAGERVTVVAIAPWKEGYEKNLVYVCAGTERNDCYLLNVGNVKRVNHG